MAADHQTKQEATEAEVNKANRDIELAGISATNTQSGAARGESRPTPVKLDKVENLKFDGEYRHYAAFIKEFKLIVVPNRDPTDIGLRLKQAIPKQFSHLLANIDLN